MISKRSLARTFTPIGILISFLIASLIKSEMVLMGGGGAGYNYYGCENQTHD